MRPRWACSQQLAISSGSCPEPFSNTSAQSVCDPAALGYLETSWHILSHLSCRRLPSISGQDSRTARNRAGIDPPLSSTPISHSSEILPSPLLQLDTLCRRVRICSGSASVECRKQPLLRCLLCRGRMST